jgi:hypothetical protein
MENDCYMVIQQNANSRQDKNNLELWVSAKAEKQQKVKRTRYDGKRDDEKK